jgi:hypothetical protein
MSKIFSDLLSFDEGYELFSSKVPSELYGKTFGDAMYYYRNRGALPIALFDGDNPNTQPLINPLNEEKITELSRIVYIAENDLSGKA